VQAAHAPLSKRHSNVDPDSVLENAKVGDVAFVALPPAGPDEIEVSGGRVSAGGGPLSNS
jgi:hypothetical protein